MLMRGLVEAEEYKASMEKLGHSIQQIDHAVSKITMAISQRPDKFPLAPGLAETYIAHSQECFIDGHRIRPYIIWFRILDEDRIELLDIELLAKEVFEWPDEED